MPVRRGMRHKSGSSRFYSRAQWRWAFATHQPWAKKHARKTPGGPVVRYRALPMRKSIRRKAR